MNPQNSTLKSSTFQMRINPEVKKEAENVFSTYGLTLSDAVNIFLQNGHTRIGMIGGPADIFTGQERLMGYRLGLL